MKAIVIEDEKLAADHLIRLIEQYNPPIEVVERLGSVKKSIDWFSKNPPPEIAFFDIQLSDGLSFEIFERTTVRCPVIFTTAFNEYAIQAFKFHSVDYLLKPIDFDELKAALDKFRLHHKPSVIPTYDALIESLMDQLTDSYKRRFVVKVGEHIKSIPVSDILYFHSLEKATFLNTADDHNYVIDYSLDQVEDLVDPSRFFRINRKYLIAMNAIDDIVAYSNSRLKIELKHSDTLEAIVAREKVGKFKDWLDR
jgi:DNA-binding LytR/AlgR family response regulator